MEKKDWEMREYKERDEHDIIKLFEEVWGEPMGINESLKFWRWMFKNNPFGDLNIVLGVDDGKIVGQYTVVPTPMVINNKRFTGSLSLHTIVHPDYQGQGMFTTMASKLYDILKKKDIHLTYGFPNENSIHAFKKYLDWKEILEIPLMARPINFKKSASMMFGEGAKSKIIGGLGKKYYRLKHSPSTPPSDVDITKIDEFSKEFDELWERVKKDFNISLVRNSEYLNWRFVKKPEYDYDIFSLRKDSKLVGYAVTYVYKYEDLDIMLIMDLLVENNSEKYSKYLISHCIEEGRNKNVDSICSIVWNLEKSYKKLGFREIGFEKLPQKKYFGVRKNTHKMNDNVLFDPKNWYINWADTPGY